MNESIKKYRAAERAEKKAVMIKSDVRRELIDAFKQGDLELWKEFYKADPKQGKKWFHLLPKEVKFRWLDESKAKLRLARGEHSAFALGSMKFSGPYYDVDVSRSDANLIEFHIRLPYCSDLKNPATLERIITDYNKYFKKRSFFLGDELISNK